MTVIIGRSGWKALPPNRIAPPLQRGLTVVIHHSATGFAGDILDAEAITLAIQRDHLSRLTPDGRLELSDIAYNLLVGPDVILLGRGLDMQGGATGNGYDDRTVSVCVIGNLAENELPAAERRALVAAIQMAWDRFGVTSIEPHRNFYSTSCPGDHLVATLPVIEAEAKGVEDMTPEQFAAMLGPSASVRDGVVGIDLKHEDGSPDGWWPVADVLEFTHRHIKAIDIRT